MEKRRYQRIAIENLSVDVADGVGFFQGMVSDISRSGICMTDLSERLNGDVKKMTVVVSGKGANFRMNVRPRWYTHGGVRKIVGVEMINAPVGWAEFVIGVEPVFQQDILDENNI
jgi:hypothetical protein